MARNYPRQGTEEYWIERQKRLSGRLCRCGCGQPVEVSLEWVQSQDTKRNVWVPKYRPEHAPWVQCACGCGLMVESVDARGRPRRVLNAQHAARLRRPSSDPTSLCACGCGTLVLGAKGHFVRGHGNRRAFIHSLDEVERSVILGTLLGDFSISKPCATPRLAFTHGLKQIEYAQHKMKVLARLSWQWKIAQTSGFGGNLGIRGSSASLPVLNDIYDLVRPLGGKKTVSEAWLDQLDDRGLAYWLMDDGSVTFSVKGGPNWIQLHTEGYSEAEHDLMVEWFRDRSFRGVYKYCTKGRYWRLNFPKSDAELLLGRVSSYIHSSMAYKLRR